MAFIIFGQQDDFFNGFLMLDPTACRSHNLTNFAVVEW
ncbi:conserved hypothetical protein [delta proteobacterium NaphS2]|nr:conserved hypothetical protein [delta proteobacterium NaphS2]